jgi:hypothetical protein
MLLKSRIISRFIYKFVATSVRIKRIKLKSPNFGTFEVMEAESQAVLNTLTEHDGGI